MQSAVFMFGDGLGHGSRVVLSEKAPDREAAWP
jgi:hypothetical protein